MGLAVLAIIEGVIEHFFVDFKLPDWLGPKVLTVFLVAICGAFLVILRSQEKLLDQTIVLLETLRAETPALLKAEITHVLEREGKQLLKDTLVQTIVTDAVSASSGRARFHETALRFLKILHETDEDLAPAFEIIARSHVDQLKAEVGNLQHDEAKSEMYGKQQVEISEAFARACRSSIVFYDPTIYQNIATNWSPAFKRFVQDIALFSTVPKKVQYIFCENSAVYDNPASDGHLMAFVEHMKGARFEVFLIGESPLQSGSVNYNLGWRLELYDKKVVVKVQTKTQYNEKDPLRVTVRSYEHDVALKRAIGDMEKFAKRLA